MALKYRTDLGGMEGKVWQEYQIRVLCERLHILCVHASLHEQAHNCACVNFNVCERRDKERALIQLQVSRISRQ